MTGSGPAAAAAPAPSGKVSSLLAAPWPGLTPALWPQTVRRGSGMMGGYTGERAVMVPPSRPPLRGNPTPWAAPPPRPRGDRAGAAPASDNSASAPATPGACAASPRQGAGLGAAEGDVTPGAPPPPGEGGLGLAGCRRRHGCHIGEEVRAGGGGGGQEGALPFSLLLGRAQASRQRRLCETLPERVGVEASSGWRWS